MNPEDIITLENGQRFHVEGFSALSPEQQEQRIRQMNSQLRVQTAAGRTVGARDALRTAPGLGGALRPDPGTWMFDVGQTIDAVGRGLTAGLGHYAGAAATGLPFLNPEGTPLHGLNFWERRDALRQADEWDANRASPTFRETIIPGAELVSSVGAGFGPASRAVVGPRAAAAEGGTLGAIHGLGQSDADSAAELAGDTALGGGAGVGAGILADMFLDRLVGGAARGVFADEDSAAAFVRQEALGLEPSVGSIGNRTAQSLENAFAEAPLTAGVSRAADPYLPGRSATGVQERQIGAVEGALEERVTGPLRGGAPGPTSDADLAADVQSAAQTTIERGDQAIQDIEGQLTALVPPRTPVPLGPVRAVPDQLRREGRDVGMINTAEDIVRRIEENPALPVDPQRARQLAAQRGTIQGQNQQIEAQIAALRQSDDPTAGQQIRRLEATLRRNNTQIGRLDALIRRNEGVGFQALRDVRTPVGQIAEEGGFRNLPRTVFYGPMSRSLRAGVARARGPGGAAQFDEAMAAERQIHEMMDIARPFSEGQLANVAGRVRRAVQRGNWRDIDAISSQLTAQETRELQAGLIDMMGRSSVGEGFDIGQFSRQWASMPEEARTRLFANNPEGRVVADQLAEVAADFRDRGRAANHSNTATAAGVMAGLGAAVSSPGKVVTFISTVLGIERAVASEAMARAVAGRPTELGNLIRRVVYTTAGIEGPDALSAAQEQNREQAGVPR